jgi:hypothetical protein
MNFEKDAESLLYELWFQYAERLFARVVEVCELDAEQEEALKELFLRPNQFVVELYG